MNCRHASATIVLVSACLAAGCGPPEAGTPPATASVELDRRCRAPAMPIPEVQGAGPASPLLGRRVVVQGVVTGDFQGRDALEGFFLQQPEGDGDPRTSDAVFVHTPRGPEVAPGDVVRVEGTAGEFFERTEVKDLRQLVICGRGAAVAPTPLAMPFAGQPDFEPLEGMLVTVPVELAVTDLYNLGRFGQIGLAAQGRLTSPTNGTAPADALPPSRRLLIADDGMNVENPRPVPYLRDGRPPRAGDTVAELTGVLTFSHRRWLLEPTVPPRFAPTNPRRGAPPPLAGDLRLAAMNVLNYFTTLGERGAATAEELERQRRKLVAALVALDADVLGLIEIENRSPALADLLQALNAELGEERYAAVDDPPDGLGTDAIRVALIYRRDRVRPVGRSRAAGDAVFRGRPPLAQTFEVIAGDGRGEALSVVVAHFKSKGGCDEAKGPDRDQGDGQGCWNDLRTRQAHRMAGFAGELRRATGDPDVLLIGDLNAHGAEDPIRTLVAAGLADQMAAHVSPAERYSYVHRGVAGYLDHALASASLAGRVAGAAFWHVNADESPLLSYRSDNPPELYRPDPFRSSDHDPVIVTLSF